MVNSRDGSVAGISKGTRSKNSVSRIGNSKRCSIDVDKIYSCSFGFLLIFFLVLLSASHHESVVMPAFGFFGVSVYDSSDLLVEDAVMNVCLFGMEIFIKRRSDNTVRVDGYTKLFSSFTNVSVISECQ